MKVRRRKNVKTLHRFLIDKFVLGKEGVLVLKRFLMKPFKIYMDIQFTDVYVISSKCFFEFIIVFKM